MRRGEVVHRKYVVIDTIGGGGKSQSARAKVGDDLVFLKKLLQPKYPFDPGPEDPVKTAKKVEMCREFEQRHIRILQLLAHTKVGGGNLVKPVDFFREGGSYYKVYPLVAADESTGLVHETASRQVLFVKTLLLSLRELHAENIVHSDIKPDNVMIERRPAGAVAKLIDFDDAFFGGQPPRRLGGDPVYFSPELSRQMNGEGDPSQLGTASDIFSLGLVVHRLVTGSFPKFVGGVGDSPAEIVGSGGSVAIGPLAGFPPAFNGTLARTSLVKPADRPDIEALLEAIGVPRFGSTTSTTPPTAPAVPVPPGSGSSPSLAPAGDSTSSITITSTIGRRSARAADTRIGSASPDPSTSSGGPDGRE